MIDIESRVADCLRADAEQAITLVGLHDGAVARARVIRRRRRVFSSIAGAGLAAVVATSVVAAPQLAALGGGKSARLGVTAAAPVLPPPVKLPTTLPGRIDVPTADQRPTAVGTDPTALHFDVDLAALHADVSDWTAAKGYERMAVPSPTGLHRIEIILGTDEAVVDGAQFSPFYSIDKGVRESVYKGGPKTPTTVNGRPGTLQRFAMPGSSPTMDKHTKKQGGEFSWILRWQPKDGLYALVQVYDVDQKQAFEVAKTLRLDRTQRCVAPLRLTTLPAGTTLADCRVQVRKTPVAKHGVWVHSSIGLSQPGGKYVSFWAERATKRVPHDLAQFKPTRMVAGHPAQWFTDESTKGLWVLNFDHAEVFVAAGAEPDAVAVAEGMKWVGDLARPETWPQSSIG